MIKKGFLWLKSSFLPGVILSALVAGAILVPDVKAAIKEDMPGTIPAEILADWKAQDGTNTAAVIDAVKTQFPEFASKITGTGDEGYKQACHWRRVGRMKQFPYMESIMFTRQHNMGAIAVGFWVNVGGGVTDTYFEAKGALCHLKFDDYYSKYTEILTKSDAAVRDPCISLDGKKVVFAMSGNGKGTGYRIYELPIDDPSKIKQLTQNPSGLTVADFEPCYLPNGDIMFASTRCFGVIDCGWQATTNMFIMNNEGKFLRQVSYDQVHVGYPVLRPDGTVLFFRWEYNDRDIANIGALFSMNPDGCHQTEVFGNQTTWPMLFVQGRPVPGSPNLFFAIASGHHGDYSGEALICDISKGSNGPDKVKMISPPRTTETRDKNDTFAWGGIYRNSEYPYPLDQDWYLVGYREDNSSPSMGSPSNNTPFKIYLKSVDGKSRELLAWGNGSLHHPVVVAPWKNIWGSDPFPVSEQANFSDSMGTFTMQNVYEGEGMKGVQKGVAKKIRVTALRYRVSGACENGWAGMLSGGKPSGVIFSAPTICPIALYGGSWDVKEVLGETPINEDGSAAFKVKARTPVFFNVLDSTGCSIAGMRSWSTLMPGETFSCLGCHESKAEAPSSGNTALGGTAQKLETPLGIENQGFDYPKMVQPIFDAKCKSCHSSSSHASGFDLTGTMENNSGAKKSFARSYTSLMKNISSAKSNKAINIATIFSQAPQMPAYSYGSAKSGLIKAVLAGTMPKEGGKLTEKEIRILATWIDLEAPHSGAYDSYMSSSDAQKYQQLEANAKKWYDAELQNVKEFAQWQKDHPNPGDTVAIGDLGIVKSISSQMRIGFISASRSLILSNASQGKLLLVDLRGRVVSRYNLSDLQSNSNVTVSLPASLSTGLYVARFEGVNGIQEAKISITQ